jgi:hypothetical protein
MSPNLRYTHRLLAVLSPIHPFAPLSRYLLRSFALHKTKSTRRVNAPARVNSKCFDVPQKYERFGTRSSSPHDNEPNANQFASTILAFQMYHANPKRSRPASQSLATAQREQYNRRHERHCEVIYSKRRQRLDGTCDARNYQCRDQTRRKRLREKDEGKENRKPTD